MSLDVDDFLTALRAGVVDGDIDAALPFFGDTLTVFVDDRILRFATPDEVRQSLADFHGQAMMDGMRDGQPEVTSRGPVVQGRVRLRITWTFLMGNGASHTGLATYYCRVEDRHPRVELVEVHDSGGFTDIPGWYPGRAVDDLLRGPICPGHPRHH